SLKSDEETGNHKNHFIAQGQLKFWGQDGTGGSYHCLNSQQEVTSGQVRAVWDELGVGAGGSLSREELSLVCDHIGIKDLQSEALEALFRKLDKDQDGRVSLREFQSGLFTLPMSTSTPARPKPLRPITKVRAAMATLSVNIEEMYCSTGLAPACSVFTWDPKDSLAFCDDFSEGLEERILRSTSPSLLSATVGQRLLTRLDDGSGCTSPEKVVALWTEEGIHNSRDILQTLEFSLEERLCLAELTLALDNELLVSGNGIHQAALVSYKNEIHYLQVLADQACQERDKAKADLDQADRRNLQLVREVDDHHATMESLNESKIKGLEQEFRDKLTALRSESEYESEVLLDRVEKERERLREELELLRAQELNLQEDICTAAVMLSCWPHYFLLLPSRPSLAGLTVSSSCPLDLLSLASLQYHDALAANLEENRRLEEEVGSLKEKLAEAEGTISKLQKDLDHLLQEKYGGLDGNGSGQLNQEEHFTEVFKEYEKQCRELQDRNDELCSELELLKTQGSGRRARQSMNNLSAQDWSDRRTLTTESDSADDPEMKKGTSPRVRKKLQVTDKNGLGSLEGVAPPVSIETELAMEQMKERYEREIQDLKIQLETKAKILGV
ncbi:hypothetical protein DNTS_025367, partial [Danionella cerebrum]